MNNFISLKKGERSFVFNGVVYNICTKDNSWYVLPENVNMVNPFRGIDESTKKDVLKRINRKI